MNNRITKGTVLSVLILGGLVSSQVTYANTIPSRADVQFKPASESKPVDPADPENPNPKPIDPNPEPPIVYPGGPLRLNHVPRISFGVNEINAQGQVISALLENVIDSETKNEIPKASFVEVADETGSLRGWEVTVQSDGIFKTADNDRIDATITFKDAAVRGLLGMENNQEVAPIATSTFSIGKDYPGATSVLKAEPKKGYNKWQVRYGHSDNAVIDDDNIKRNANVTLTVPQGQLVLADKEYVANVTWSLVQGL